MSFPELLVARTVGALLLVFKWMLVLATVLVLLVVVPIIELLAELFQLARRAFARLR